jgi:predicted HTH transcriptional regulator
VSFEFPEERNRIEYKSRVPDDIEETVVAFLNLSNMRSPRQSLAFRQLEIYYAERKLALTDEFLSSLDLVSEDGSFNYAAYLLADENGVSVKVAKYAGKTKVDLVENEEYGYRCLITATNRVLEKLRVENKTFAKVTSQKRLERRMIDENALKEAVVNAIVHNDYSREVPPVVEIFSDRLTITSYGGLPQGLSRENFFRCRSMPRNRELMRIFKDVGVVEQLGSGMSRILEAYDPSIFTFEDNFLIVTFPFANGFDYHVTTAYEGTHDSMHEGTHEGTHDKINKILEYCAVPRTRDEMQAHVGIATREYFRKSILKPLLNSGQIVMTVQDKPKSRNQKYVAAGRRTR